MAMQHVELAGSRRLLGLLVTNGAKQELDEVLIYLHGFPDMTVHPKRPEFADRVARKLAEFWLSDGVKQESRKAFVGFNYGGVPGSDDVLRFTDKTVGQELQDTVAVCEDIRKRWLKPSGKLHVVGLSTGAILGSLLRDQHAADSITVIAGLLDVVQGVHYDFSPLQLQQCKDSGYCWKEFYLPEDCPLPKNVELSLDGVEPTTEISEDDVPHKLYIRLHERYVQEFLDGSLDIRRAVSGAALPPLFVIHGDADDDVPFSNGEELFAAAAEPKRFLAIPKANHMLTNSKLLKKALRAIGEHVESIH